MPYGGTGFVVGEGLLMTNRHVAEMFTEGLGEGGLRLQRRATAAVDFKRERAGGRPRPTLKSARW